MRTSQQGAALIMAMLMLILLSMLGATLLSGANQELKTAGAASERTVAEHWLEGELNKVLIDEELSSVISTMIMNVSIEAASRLSGASGTLEATDEVNCKRSFSASSTNVTPVCRYIRVENSRTYGKAGVASQTIAAGVEQPLLSTVN
jgi:type IV pilus assembly protein PilX